MTPAFWKGRRVLVTGHTGFKGAWLAFWLTQLGAKVAGVSLPPDSDPNLYGILGLSKLTTTRLFDVNDGAMLAEFLDEFNPSIVLHLAAQALVRTSYDDPVETFATNVLGVVSLLDAVRSVPSATVVPPL